MSDPLPSRRPPLRRIVGGLLFFALAVGVVWMGPNKEAVVLYCAHDARFAEEILDAFTEETGIPVRILFDTEATKSLGLIERIKREAKNPQADVFWNNEFLGMLDLHEQGLLEPHAGPGWERIPAAFRDPEGHWTGFGARLRVWAVNTNALPAELSAIRERLASPDLSRVALAKPMYGTTLTEFSVLWERLGREGMQAHYDSLRQRGLRLVNGNAIGANLTADGVFDLCFTDTDDAFDVMDKGSPVAMLPLQLEDGATISIPNTVAILRGTPNRANAEALVDFLLSAETELRLANGKARQIPLGPVDESRLPDEVKALKPYAARGVALHGLLGARRACLDWLRQSGDGG